MHKDITLLMSLVLDGEATAEEEGALREHLHTCTGCASTWQRWQELDRRFEGAPMAMAPAGLAAAVLARVETAQVVSERRHSFALWLGLASAAVLVLAGLVALVVVNWPLELPGAASAAISGFAGVAGWLWREAVEVLATAGAPTVAATAGALLCLTCILAMVWLWIVNRGVPAGEPAHSLA